MANPIVVVNVTQTQAPLPAALQKTGALISQGGTTLGVGEYSLLTQLSDLTPLLATPLSLTSVAWASTFGGQVTATAAANHGIAAGQQFTVTIADVVPAAYNGTYLAMATGAATFTYYLTANPGAQTTAGTYTPRNSAELVSMATTFFTQGAQQGVYVLELGAGEPSTGVANLSAFITANGQIFYSYLVPRNWDGDSTFLTFLGGFESTTAKTYFFVTTSLQNRGVYEATMKCVEAFVEAPFVGAWPTNVITNATYSGGRVTLTTTSAHGIIPGQYFSITGFTPDGYNGTFLALNGTTGSTLIYAVPADPGADSVQGVLVASLYVSDPPPAAQFDHAADFWVTLNYDPSTTNKVTPFAFSYLYGVTEFPIKGNAARLSSLKTSSDNYVGTGAEGGITNTMLLWGHVKDGRPFNYWYSVDWMQINGALFVANAIINGSNTPINPLYYDQNGINRLQQVLAGVGGSAITYGLALGKVIQTELNGPDFALELDRGTYAGNVVVNAVPFVPYSISNPSHYRIGKYDGLSVTFTPLRGFESITININVTDFVAG